MTVEVKDMIFDKVAIGPVSVRVYQGEDYAKGPPVILYFHGGAFLESGIQDSQLAASLASTGAIVAVPDYNGLLGGVFPQPLEVGFSIFSYLAKKRAGLGNRKSLLMIGGEEAGGNIAAAVALKARDHFASELDGQLLFSPLLDPFMSSETFHKAEDLGMRERWADGWSHYLSGGVCHPYAAPCMCSRLTGVAPAFLMSSDDDPLCAETMGYCNCLKHAGVKTRQHILPAGTGWPSIYGGKTEHSGCWQQSLCSQFSAFVQDISTR